VKPSNLHCHRNKRSHYGRCRKPTVRLFDRRRYSRQSYLLIGRQTAPPSLSDGIGAPVRQHPIDENSLEIIEFKILGTGLHMLIEHWQPRPKLQATLYLTGECADRFPLLACEITSASVKPTNIANEQNGMDALRTGRCRRLGFIDGRIWSNDTWPAMARGACRPTRKGCYRSPDWVGYSIAQRHLLYNPFSYGPCVVQARGRHAPQHVATDMPAGRQRRYSGRNTHGYPALRGISPSNADIAEYERDIADGPAPNAVRQ
jgi:hypothetical protein